mgnify:CR=1 FL=1
MATLGGCKILPMRSSISEINPNQIDRWKREFLEEASDLFSKRVFPLEGEGASTRIR